MNVAVIGTGYVGLVSGSCLADLGHQVTCVDTDRTKVEKLWQGIMPIFEPGLEEMVKRNVSAGRLKLTDRYEDAIPNSEVISIAVGTPSNEDGSVDMRFVFGAMESLAPLLHDGVVIANKSTVPVGTAEKCAEIIRSAFTGSFDVVSNPEFLREGHAVTDFLHPPRIVIGSSSSRAIEIMQRLYSFIDCPKLIMSIRSAELTKYAANAFLATKVSFINEIAHLAEEIGADIDEIAKGIGSDPRIGKEFLRAGPGWGGSCFPKDVRALCHLARTKEYALPIISAACHMNDRARSRIVERTEKALTNLKGKTIGFLGLAFKNNTDDTRESPALDLARLFYERGASVTAYDAKAVIYNQNSLSQITRVADPYDATHNADAIILATEWDEFRTLDFVRIKSLMRGDLVMDARNMLDGEAVKSAGLRYFRIGRK